MDVLTEVVAKAQSWLLELIALSLFGVVIALTLMAKKIVTGWLLGRKKPSKLQRYHRADVKIVETLAEIRVATAADRACVFRFHNGSRYIDGEPMLRMTCSHESVGSGYVEVREHAQNILVSTVPEALGFLSAKDPGKKAVVIKTAGMERCFYCSVLKAQGVKAVAKFPLFKGRDIVGFVSIDYIHTEDVTDDMLSNLKELAPRVEHAVNQEADGSLTALWDRLRGRKGR